MHVEDWFTGTVPAWMMGDDPFNEAPTEVVARLCGGWLLAVRPDRPNAVRLLPVNGDPRVRPRPLTEPPPGAEEATAIAACVATGPRGGGAQPVHGHLYLGGEGRDALFVHLARIHVVVPRWGAVPTGGPGWLMVGNVHERRHGVREVWTHAAVLRAPTVRALINGLQGTPPADLEDLGPPPGVDDWLTAHRTTLDGDGLVQIGGLCAPTLDEVRAATVLMH